MADPHPPFPREIEALPDVATALRARLDAGEAPLWPGADLAAPRIPLTAALADGLGRAARTSSLAFGLEAATARLDGEARGLDVADARSGGPRPARISRLLLVADDGAERFYRGVERVLRRHGSRLLACRLSVGSEALGQTVSGRPSRLKAVLVEDKRLVADLLRTIAGGDDAAA